MREPCLHIVSTSRGNLSERIRYRAKVPPLSHIRTATLIMCAFLTETYKRTVYTPVMLKARIETLKGKPPYLFTVNTVNLNITKIVTIEKMVRH